MTAEEQLQYLSSRQAALDAQDYLSQGLRLDARISLKLAQLDVMRDQRKKLCQALGRAAEELPPPLFLVNTAFTVTSSPGIVNLLPVIITVPLTAPL